MSVCKGWGGGVRVLGLRQTNTCRKVPLQVNFFTWLHFALLSMSFVTSLEYPFNVPDHTRWRQWGTWEAKRPQSSGSISSSLTAVPQRQSQEKTGTNVVFKLHKIYTVYINQCWGSGSAGSACFRPSDPLVRGTDPDPDPSLYSQRCWADWNKAWKIKGWYRILANN